MKGFSSNDTYIDVNYASDPIGSILLLLVIVAIVVIIINIVNLFKAKKYLLAGNQEPRFKRFLFWPNALKFLTVLASLLGLLGFALKGMLVASIMKTMQAPPGHYVAMGFEEALFSLSTCLIVAVSLLSIYGVFRLILHIMYQRSLNATDKK